MVTLHFRAKLEHTVVPKKFRIRVTGEKNVGKTVFPTSGWKRTSHSFKSIT